MTAKPPPPTAIVCAALNARPPAAPVFLITTHPRPPSRLGTAQQQGARGDATSPLYAADATQKTKQPMKIHRLWASRIAVGDARVTLRVQREIAVLSSGLNRQTHFLHGIFSSWRTRSAETPYRSASSCKVLLLSSSSQRARMMSWLRSSRPSSAALSLSAA
ncbi:hypothetical protein SODG_003069 [Sodalis praecaptivus]